MKKQVLLFFAILLLSIEVSGQIFVPSKSKLYQSLIGDVYTFYVFIDTKEDYWEDGEKEFYLNQLELSQEWLVEEASYYDMELEFINDRFYQNGETVYLEKLTNRQYSRNSINNVLNELGYDNFKELMDNSNFNFEEKKLKFLFFVKSQDRSHAYNRFSNGEVDLAVIYCRSSYGMRVDNFVISHEILHLFGAWDLYQGKSQPPEIAQKAMDLYPSSIMINTKRHKEELEVDDLTAWRVGWHYEFKEEYPQFDPNRRKKDKTKGNLKSKKGYRFNLGKNKN